MRVEVFRARTFYTPRPDDLDVLDATFARLDLTTFCRLDRLGLHVLGQRLEPDRAVLACRVVGHAAGVERVQQASDPGCPRVPPAGLEPALVAFVDEQPVGCGSLSVVDAADDGSAEASAGA